MYVCMLAPGLGATVYLLHVAEVRAQCAAGHERVCDHGRLLPGLAAQQRRGSVHHRPTGLAGMLLSLRLLTDSVVVADVDLLVHLAAFLQREQRRRRSGDYKYALDIAQFYCVCRCAHTSH